MVDVPSRGDSGPGVPPPAETPQWLPHYLGGSHGSRLRELLTPLDRQRWRAGDSRRPGAIVVPTSRPSTSARSGLPFAARLAVDVGCPLVVIASKDAAKPSAVGSLGEQITVETRNGRRQPDTLVLFPAATGTALTRFETADLTLSKAYRRGGELAGKAKLRVNDVGRKRNLALLLAAGQGWRSVLFLDDDVFDARDGKGDMRRPHDNTLDVAALRAGVRAVEDGGQLAVGWAARDFDDNSVLCRMATETGAVRDQFIGGGALLVHVQDRTPFFPSIYNEDWLFVLNLLERRVSGVCDVLDGGEVHQDEYFPFRVKRAAAEELGDILGEGMLSLLHADAREQVLLPEFWRRALRERCALKDRVREQVLAGEHMFKNEMLDVLRALDVIHERLRREEEHWVGQFVTFAQAWRRDLETWQRRLRLDDVPSPARLVRSQEFDAARTFGSSGEPEGFLRRHSGSFLVKARRRLLVRA